MKLSNFCLKHLQNYKTSLSKVRSIKQIIVPPSPTLGFSSSCSDLYWVFFRLIAQLPQVTLLPWLPTIFLSSDLDPHCLFLAFFLSFHDSFLVE